jgi:hypothetical protein
MLLVISTADIFIQPSASAINSQNIFVGIAFGYVLEGLGSIVDKGKIFLLSTASTLILGQNQPSIQWVPRMISPGVKRPEFETSHSFACSVDVLKC